MKRIISTFTILCLLFATISVTVSATTGADVSTTEIKTDATAEIVQENETVPYCECIDIESYNAVETYLSNEIIFNFSVTPLSEYDYIHIAYASTTGLTLSSYMSDRIAYNEVSTNIPIGFTISESIATQSMILDFHTASFEKIYVNMYAYLDGNVIQERQIIIYVLSTDQKNYVSLLGDVYAYEKYVKELFANEIITLEAYTVAYRTITSTNISYDHSIYSDEYIEEQLSKVYVDTTPVRYYDARDSVVKSSTINNWGTQLITRENLNSTNISTNSSSEARSSEYTSITPVKIVFQREIIASNSGKQLRILGEVRWTDVNGNFYKASNVKIEIIDREVSSDDVIATVYTNVNGAYDITIAYDTGIFEGGYDISYRVWSAGSNFTVKAIGSDNVYSDGYYFAVTDSDNIKASKSAASYICSAGSDVSKAFNIHQAMVVGYHYYSAMNNSSVHSTNVYFDSTTDGNFNVEASYIQIAYDCYLEWDTIIHELGHAVSKNLNFSATNYTGSTHSLKANLLEYYSKNNGIKIAWNEGWADYYSIAAQEYYNKNVKNISSIVGVANLSYDSFFSESSRFRWYSDPIKTYIGFGEGNEYAISATFYDLVNANIITEKDLFTKLKTYQPGYFSEFIQDLYSFTNKNLYSTVGEILEKHNISDKANIANNTQPLYSRSTPGKFYWTLSNRADGMNCSFGDTNFTPATSTSVKFVFWDEDFNIVYQTSLYSQSTAGTAITLTASQWNTITSAIDGDFFYWCVATYQSSSPTTGPYYSEFHKEPFTESATQISTMGSEYEDTLTAGGERWFTFTSTKNGYYCIYSQGNIDVRSDVFSYHNFASESQYDDDSGNQFNFLQLIYLSAGNTIFIKVTGYNSNTVGAFSVLCSYMENATSLTSTHTGYAYSLIGNWYFFEVNTTGSYTFYTTGDSDTFGEIYEFPIPDGTTANRLAVDTDSGEGNNFSITYTLYEGDLVFIRILGDGELYTFHKQLN